MRNKRGYKFIFNRIKVLLEYKFQPIKIGNTLCTISSLTAISMVSANYFIVTFERFLTLTIIIQSLKVHESRSSLRW